jgi:glycerophosphoryl diester phosphodiesterase
MPPQKTAIGAPMKDLPPVPRPFADLPRPLLFAHRGASRIAPENTFDAFDLAVRLGADVLEMDVHLTADGEVVVFHDATLERTTNGQGPISEKTFAELHRLDAGCKFRTPSGVPLFVDRQVSIPRLADLVATFPRCAFNIELKHADPKLLTKVLEAIGPLPPQQVVLAAENDRIMGQIEASGSPYGLSMARGQIKRAVRQGVFGCPPREFAGRAMQIPPRHWGFPLAGRHLIQTMHRAAIEVHLWVINDLAQAKRYLARGVDGIMSDDPGALIEAVHAHRPKRTPPHKGSSADADR